MMKRNLLFALLVAFGGSFTLQAQTLQRATTNIVTKNHIKVKAKVAITDNQKWWGYGSENDERAAVGLKRDGEYDQAIHLSGKNPLFKNKTIKGIRFYLRSTEGLSNVKVWASKYRVTNLDNADVIQSLDVSKLQGGDEGDKRQGFVNEVLFEKPYTITNSGVNVGLSFKTSGTDSPQIFPIVVYKTTDPDLKLYLRHKGQFGTSWKEFDAADNGIPAIQVLLEGDYKPIEVLAKDFGSVSVGVGKTTKVTIPLMNLSKMNDPITSITYKVLTDGVGGEEQTINLAKPFTGFGIWTPVEFELKGDTKDSEAKKEIKITKVNGKPNAADAVSSKGVLQTLAKEFPHGVLVEELTGLTCPNCPMGWVGMANLHKAFPDNFVGVAIHSYSNGISEDAMFFPLYDSNLYRILNAAPTATIERAPSIHAYGMEKSFAKALARLPYTGITLNATYSADGKQVIAKTQVETLRDGNFKLAYVLVADGLTGTTSNWKQYNGLSRFKKDALPEDLKIFGQGGQYGKSTVALVYDDVAIGSSWKNGRNTVETPAFEKGKVVENTFTLNLPTYSALLNALKRDQVYVVAIVFNPNGTVDNAKKVKVNPKDPAGITETKDNGTELREVARYNANGQRINAPVRGVNIVKFSDGSVVKVMVK